MIKVKNTQAQYESPQGTVCGPRCQIRGHGRHSVRAIPDLTQRTYDQFYELSGHNDQHPENKPISTGSTGVRSLKQAVDRKVEDIKAGYNILLACLDTADKEYTRLNAVVEQTIDRHATISRRTVEASGAAPAAQQGPKAAPARAGWDQVKLKEGLKPTILTLDFNPQ